MFRIDSPKKYIFSLSVQVIIYMLQVTGPAIAKGNCLTGRFLFTQGKDMVENHALCGHVIANVTATEPVRCFRACQLDCRCISFNYQQSLIKDNCQLNEENRYTNFSALEFAEGWQYYDLVIDYNIRANVPLMDCQNGCCGNHPCLNGGICHETCDVLGKRFTCECGPHFTGRLCENATCSTPDWLRFQNSCFKLFTEQVNWFDAQQSCVSINSNLTSILSAEENEFVRQVVVPDSSRFWIGLFNLNSTDYSYEWVDGSELSFTNWNDGEPNNIGNENCTEIKGDLRGTWNDLNCTTNNLNYVCGTKLYP